MDLSINVKENFQMGNDNISIKIWNEERGTAMSEIQVSMA